MPAHSELTRDGVVALYTRLLGGLARIFADRTPAAYVARVREVRALEHAGAIRRPATARRAAHQLTSSPAHQLTSSRPTPEPRAANDHDPS
ncbi:MAG: hypothetical protein ACJ79A_00955 [Gemmatimonadaceae bacterium]